MRPLHEAGKLQPEEAWFFADEKPAEELYDLKNDPHELHNLIDQKKYDEVLSQMRTYLDQWQQQNRDYGLEDLGNRSLNPSKGGPIRDWLQKTHPEEWEKILAGEIVDKYHVWGKESGVRK